MAVLGGRGNHCPLYQKTGSDLATGGFRKNACRGFAFATGRHSKSCLLPFLCFDGRAWHWQDLDCFAYSCCRAGKACAGEETIFKNNIGRTDWQSSSPAQRSHYCRKKPTIKRPCNHKPCKRHYRQYSRRNLYFAPSFGCKQGW